MTYNGFLQYVSVITLCILSSVHAQDYFTVAIFAHARRGNVTSDPYEEIIMENLNYYVRAASVARENKADMVIFPESGIFNSAERKDVECFAEDIPDPKDNVCLCQHVSSISNKPILVALSCIAKKNKINVIANMVDVKNCSKDSQCREDGKLYYNTNVVFDRNGALVYRYFNEHLWFEPGMDAYTKKQNITFNIDVGYFANCIGFDIQFTRVGPDSVPDNVDAVVYPTTGVTWPPLLVASPWWQAWGIGNNIPVLAANLQIPGEQHVGSGIYAGRRGAIANTYGNDGISKLLISKVPKRNKEVSPDTVIYAINENTVEIWNTDDEHIPDRCDITLLGKPNDVYTEYRCTSEDVSNYTLVKLEEPKGQIKSCYNDMCCELDYAADSMSQSFYFGVFTGMRNINDEYLWWEENCFLARCDDIGGKPCAEFLMQSSTTFSKINMTANFTTNHIYPYLVSSEVKLVSVNDWKYETKGNQASIYFSNESNGIKMITAGFKGRNYDKDPPDTKQN